MQEVSTCILVFCPALRKPNSMQLGNRMLSSVQSSTATVHHLDSYRKTYDPPPLAPDLPQDKAVEVGDGVTRYDWSIAFARISMRRKYPAIAIAAAMRLVEFLPRGAGECDPGRNTMVDELGRSKRRIDSAYEILETDGWIKRRRGDGRDDPVIITLMIPPGDADAHQFGAKIYDRPRAARVARDDKPTTRRKTADHAQQNGRPRATQCCASKEQKQKEQEEGGVSPRPSDTSVPVAETTEGDRAFGALLRLYTLAPDIGCREEFNRIMDQSFDPEIDTRQLLDRAADYIRRCKAAGSEPKPMIQFLQNYRLEKQQ